MEHGGSDATVAFREVGHSVEAKHLLKQYKIGRLAKVSTVNPRLPPPRVDHPWDPAAQTVNLGRWLTLGNLDY